jgi:tRNA nucleotidyltransferase (CCA-adding enzyme)
MILPEAVLDAIGRLEQAGFEAVAVGGCVRDHLMGRIPADYDVATSATPAEVVRVFAGARVVPTGLPHGTVTLVSGGMALEITTYRVDGKYSDHRRPEGVRFTGSLEEDLKRRDFTVNAMAYSPSRGLIDPMGGRRDIEEKLIRAVGVPAERFDEDALRILRALRFAAKLRFQIEPETARALTAMKDALAFVARERVGAEFTGLVTGPGAEGVARAHRDVLEAALTELAAFSGADWEGALASLGRAPADAAARFAALLHPLGPGAEAALRSIRLPGRIIERAMRLIVWLNMPEAEPSRALGALGPDDARALFQTSGAEESTRMALEHLIETRACVNISQLAVNGSDLTALGLSGPAVGAMLRQLLDGVIAGEPNERDALLSRIRTLL